MSQINWLEVLNWDEDYLENLRAMAFLYIRQGEYGFAKDYFHTLTLFNPNNSFDLQTLGALYLQENDPSLALSYLQKAKTLDPNNYTIQLNHIKAMLLLGYTQESKVLLDVFFKGCKVKRLLMDAEALKMAYLEPLSTSRR